MSKRYFSAASIRAVVGVLGVALAGARLRESPRAADKPGSWGFDIANLDKTCKPCDDFYQFAMGGRMKSNPIPPEYPAWGTFTELADKNNAELRGILEGSIKANAPTRTEKQKIGDFYGSCMDTHAIESARPHPLAPDLAAIDGLQDAKSLPLDIGPLHKENHHPGFQVRSIPDIKHTTRIIA